MDCDQVVAFVEDRCTLGPGLTSTSAEIFTDYRTGWAEEAGIKRTLGRKNFTSRLQKLGVTPVKGTGGERKLAGIALRTAGLRGYSGASGVSGASGPPDLCKTFSFSSVQEKQKSFYEDGIGQSATRATHATASPTDEFVL